MPKKKEAKTEKIEKEFIIPLRKEWAKVPRYKRANRAIKAIRKYLVRHMKIRDRDLSKIKIDKYLNEEIWFRGIRKPPVRIKVKATKEGNIVKVELVDYPEKIKFKKLRKEKIEKEGEEKKKAKKLEEKPEEKETAEITEKKEEKEKKAAVVEAGEKIQKQTAKKVKHEVIKKVKQPKHQKRVALAK